MSGQERERRLARLAWGLLGVALLWRLAVFGQDLAAGQFSGLVPPRALMGLAYIGGGAVALKLATSPAARVLAIHCACQGLHWGGVLRAAEATTNTGLQVGYVVVSALGEAAFLHFMLRYPSRGTRPLSRPLLVAIYGPIAVQFLVGAGLLIADPGAWADALQTVFGVIQAVVVNLLPLAAVATLAIRFARSSRAERCDASLGLLLFVTAVAFVPYPVADWSGASELAGLLTLLFVAIPLAYVYAVVREAAKRTVEEHDSP